MKNLEKLTDAYGEVQKLITPSGHEVTIRMQTGEDDDVISNAKGAMDGTSSNKFIASIVIDTDITENRKMNLDNARDLKLCDKYFIMVASRIFSIGQHLKFVYKWNDVGEQPYEEDLGLYIWDYFNEAEPFPELGHEEYFPYRIPPHKGGKETTRVVKLSTGKMLRYKYLTGHGEKYLMNLPEEKHTVNAGIIARGLEQEMGKDKWVKVSTFKTFTPREMMDIRKDIDEMDPAIDLVTELEHPESGAVVPYPVVGSPDFFFPREI